MAATQKPLSGDELTPYEREDELEENRCPNCGEAVRSTKSQDWCVVCTQPVNQHAQHPTGKPPEMRLRIENRFWSKVEILEKDQCWPWKRYRDPNKGYGKFHVDPNNRSAHRVAYALSQGVTNPDELPDGEVMHSCHNPPCCNPAHLRLGSQKANREDSLIVGDINTKLSPPEVREIRKLVDEYTYTELADRYGVSRETIARIDRGEQYAWVE